VLLVPKDHKAELADYLCLLVYHGFAINSYYLSKLRYLLLMPAPSVLPLAGAYQAVVNATEHNLPKNGGHFSLSIIIDLDQNLRHRCLAHARLVHLPVTTVTLLCGGADQPR
jgi:hypothetical protein